MRKYLLFLLTIIIFSACRSGPQTAGESGPVIEVVEPVFEIVSIYVIQADLINTQFETVLRVNNPNDFALRLTELKYQLYGNGSFWAEGRGGDILHIPAKSSSEAAFRFSMNFINTSRRLLDDVIAMRQVRYRFRGEAEIQPDVPGIPPFIMNFNCTGLSDVKQKAE
jgi:LEA14-like dessication related protein